jgi:TPR repeat protein
VPAQQWWENGALQGNPPAQVHLGWLYELSQYVSQNNVRAGMWFNLAGANGNNNEVKHRNALAKRMIPAQIAET